jgi:dGTPase
MGSSRHQVATEAWKRLLSDERSGKPVKAGAKDHTRSEFERDFDRIVFSSPFRRLQDKTQVFPLSRNDFTRTRLTHSIEVSCVGRSLGRRLSASLKSKAFNEVGETDIGGIVAAACLAHDIGNPPFGHSGEDAIQSWARKNVGITGTTSPITFQTEEQVADLHCFEGNAQGLRIVTKLYDSRRIGGARLTLATIGAMAKYPCGSLIGGKNRTKNQIEQKKFGYFEDDSELACDVFRQLGMKEYGPGAFKRHPLVYLVEAADDICYAVMDLEDSVDQGLIDIEEASLLLEPLARQSSDEQSLDGYGGVSRFRWLRALAIQGLINSCMRVCEDNLGQLRTGQFIYSLVDRCCISKEYNAIKAKVKEKAYWNRRVLQVELVGYKVIAGLLDVFVTALRFPDSSQSQKYIALMPPPYLGSRYADLKSVLKSVEKLSDYQRVLAATDFVSGMTDTFAVDTFQKLSGIELPA